MHSQRNALVFLLVLTLLSTIIPNSVFSSGIDGSITDTSENTALSGMSTYSLTSNLTIPGNSSLVFTDTSISVVATHAIQITDYGKLEFLNSTVSGAGSNSSLIIHVLGNHSRNTGMLLFENSSVKIHGLLFSKDGSVEVLNSSISIPGAASSPGDSFRMVLENSTSLFQNSTISGLYNSTPMPDVTAAYMNYTGSAPISNPGYIPLTGISGLPQTSVIDNAEVNLEFSGNNPGNNSVSFAANGTELHYYRLNNTGSVYTKDNVSFSFSTSKLGYNLSTFISTLTARFNDSYAVGSNSTIWKVNITLYSSDLVDVTGLSYFNYILRNSSMILSNSVAGINQQPEYSGVHQPNPEKNGISLYTNSSLSFVSSGIKNATGNNSPFIIRGNSSVCAYQEVNLRPESNGYRVYNYSSLITPDNLNSSLNKLSNSSLLNLSDNLKNAGYSNDAYLSSYISNKLVLTQAVINDHVNLDVFNFNIEVDRQNMTYTTGIFPSYSSKPTNVSVNVSLPRITGTILTGSIFSNSTNTIDAKLTSEMYNSGALDWEMLYGPSVLTKFSSGRIVDISAGSTLNISSILKTGHLHGIQFATIELSVYCPNYTVSGRYINITISVNQFSSVFPSVNATYSWLSNGVLGVYVIISNPGNESLSNGTLTVRYYRDGILEKIISIPENVSRRGMSFYYLNYSGLSFRTNRIVIDIIPSPSYVLISNLTLSETLNVTPDREYNFTVYETGLPSGTRWSLSLNGLNLTSVNGTVNTELVNGSYKYTVLPVQGFLASSHSAALLINGKSTAITIVFSPFLYTVFVNETGLPGGTNWNVTVDNSSHEFLGTNGQLQLQNGSYNLLFQAKGSYSVTSSNITIHGNNISLSVHFEKIHHSYLEPLLKTIFFYRYTLAALAIILTAYTYIRYRDSVKICRKCFTTYHGFGKCPVCEARKKENESDRKK